VLLAINAKKYAKPCAASLILWIKGNFIAFSNIKQGCIKQPFILK